MSHKYVLKFSCSSKYIDNQLLPWKKYFKEKTDLSIENQEDEDIYEFVQIGIPIHKDNNIYFISPFSVLVPYSKIELLNIGDTNIELKCTKFCYFTRLALFEFDSISEIDTDIIQEIKDAGYSLENPCLNKISTNELYVDTIDNDNIVLDNSNVVFKNMVNDKIYPFIWIESDVPDLILDKLIPGSPVYMKKNNEYIGIVYNVDEKINIIPKITIIKLLNDNNLRNLYFKYDICEKEKLNRRSKRKNKVLKIIETDDNYTKKGDKLEINDYIQSVNDIVVENNGLLYFSDVNILVPINTYIWYLVGDKIKLCVTRNDKQKELYLTPKSINKKISINVQMETKYIIKDNIIFCIPNLMMTEWLTHNDIIYVNKQYLQYYDDPYMTIKNSYLFVSLIDIDNHPEEIREILKPYLSRMNNPRLFMELFTIKSINSSNTININSHESINKLILSDSNDRELFLNWLN